MSDIYKANIRNIAFAEPKGQLVGLQFLIKNVNSEKELTFFKISGSEFHIVCPKHLIELWPKDAVFTCDIKSSDCKI